MSALQHSDLVWQMALIVACIIIVLAIWQRQQISVRIGKLLEVRTKEPQKHSRKEVVVAADSTLRDFEGRDLIGKELSGTGLTPFSIPFVG